MILHSIKSAFLNYYRLPDKEHLDGFAPLLQVYDFAMQSKKVWKRGEGNRDQSDASSSH
jgi:hypothetical protein